MAFFDGDVREKFHKLTTPTDSESDWDPVISIGTAAKMVRLSVSALRKYEKEGLLIYNRTSTGRRLLSLADIRRIKMIQQLINEIGLNIEGIRRLMALLPCWELKPCSDSCEKRQHCDCVARKNAGQPCWMIENTDCAKGGEDCRQCNVYRYGAYCTETMKQLVHSTGETDNK